MLRQEEDGYRCRPLQGSYRERIRGTATMGGFQSPIWHEVKCDGKEKWKNCQEMNAVKTDCRADSGLDYGKLASRLEYFTKKTSLLTGYFFSVYRLARVLSRSTAVPSSTSSPRSSASRYDCPKLLCEIRRESLRSWVFGTSMRQPETLGSQITSAIHENTFSKLATSHE